ncbi:MAG: hypothetical protein LBV80_09100 [Deltaproteobacteria bacterium]|jgi:hypothetical protein|nr:hypothetical protein [Deltaproteobacteria bacterium]
MFILPKYTAKAALLVCLTLAAGCSTDRPEAPGQTAAQASVLAQAALERAADPTLQTNSKVLVLPFSCNILSDDSAESKKTLQAALTSRTLHLLRDAGVQADEPEHARELTGQNTTAPAFDAAAQNVAPAFDPAEEMFRPQASTASETQAGGGALDASGTPIAENGQNGEAWETVLSAGTAPEQGPEDGVVAEGTQILEPRNEATASQSVGEQLTAPVMAEATVTTDGAAASNASATPIAVNPSLALTGETLMREAEASGILETARQLGYDYVLVGTISYIHAELRPSVRQGERELSSVRAEFNCSYQLLSSDNGQALALGATSGKAGQQIRLARGEAGQAQIYNAAGKMINQALYSAAQNMVRELMVPGAAHHDNLGDWESDANYYRDSPGKRLKP